MALSNEMENVWKEGKTHEAGPAPLAEKDLQAIISSRVRKELKKVSQFVWAAIVYQIILYSFLTHTLIRHWGDIRIMLLCLAGGTLYVPLTIALIRRVRTLYCRRSEAPGSPVPDVFQRVCTQVTGEGVEQQPGNRQGAGEENSRLEDPPPIELQFILPASFP